MVMKKRLDNGVVGFSGWTVPRGPRSLRVSKIASSDLSVSHSDLLNCTLVTQVLFSLILEEGSSEEGFRGWPDLCN